MSAAVKRYTVDNPREDLGPEKVGRYLPGTHTMLLASDYDAALSLLRQARDFLNDYRGPVPDRLRASIDKALGET